MAYIVKRAAEQVALTGGFSAGAWADANVIRLENRMYPKYNIFQKLWRKWTGIAEREAQDPYAPETELKLLYDDNFIYGMFHVKDQYVRATEKVYGQQACLDSCVEFFIRPANHKRYFNFEFTAGGFLLLYHVENLRKKKFSVVTEDDCNSVLRKSSLPAVIEPEITDPTVWTLGFAIPLSLFAKYGGEIAPDLSGQTWTGNVFKCGDETSHPHWFTWQPLPKLDFHLPACFAEITFE